MTNGNEPAFGHGFSNEYGDFEVPGLTKREYFAAMALQGMLANGSDANTSWDYNVISSHCTKCADALMKALNKQL